MSTPAVYWHEGMFLRPHHFQAAERYWADQVRTVGRFDVHHNWGVRVVDLDTDALRNYRFVVNRVLARMRDGSVVVAERGTDVSVDPVDLQPFAPRLGPGDTLDIKLAVPTLQIGRANTAGLGDTSTRYHIDTAAAKVVDEHTGQNEQTVPFRRLNVKLLTPDENPSGYDTLLLARLVRSSQASAPLELHPEYVPPLLGCDGWPKLTADVISPVYNRIGGLLKQVSKQVKDQNIKLGTNNPDQIKLFEKMRVLNEGYAAYAVVAQAVGVHPFFGYLELCRLAGKLAVFHKDATFPEDLPAYDHDDLGRCFYTVKRMIDECLSHGGTQGYELRPFRGEGLRLRVGIEPSWLAPAAQMLVGVESNLAPDACVRLLTGRLNMKIAALERVDETYVRGLRGLAFIHDNRPPSILPGGTNLVYFRIDRNASADEWTAVNQSYNVAIRINQNLLVGAMDGKQEVTIQADGKTASMRFVLYVVLPGTQTN